MSDYAKVERLHQLLNNAHVRDEEIKGGVRLGPTGYAKLTRLLGVSSDELDRLLLLLARQLDNDLTEAAHARFTYEDDYLGNVTVRDAKTGDENYFGGSEAIQILNSLHGLQSDSPQAQEILGHWMMRIGTHAAGKALTEAAGRKKKDAFVSEIKNETGSYNFPWQANGKSGTATAAYTGDGDTFRLKIVDVRDRDGNEVEGDDTLMRLLKSQALHFIGDE